jgi:methyl-accepting chemotaxis protein
MSLRLPILDRLASSVSAAWRYRPANDRHLMAEIVRVCQRAAMGDNEARITVDDATTELGEVGNSINQLLDMSDAFVREAAAAMSHCSKDQFHRPILLRGMHGSFRQSALVINQAGRSMRASSQQLVRVAELASETATNVGSVASACDRLDAQGREIVAQASDSSRESRTVVEKVTEADRAVGELGASAKEVGKIIAVIATIAEQTHLLALNASIEAARAGDAGRGFAVVAREVQDLAQSVAQASGQIGEQVTRMRGVLSQVVALMASVNQSVTHVSESAVAISHSVGEQATATRGIAESIAEVRANSEQVSQSFDAARRDASAASPTTKRGGAVKAPSGTGVRRAA